MIKSHLGTAIIEISETEKKVLDTLNTLLPPAVRASDDLESTFYADLVTLYKKSRETFGDDKTLDILTKASKVAFVDLPKKGANHGQ